MKKRFVAMLMTAVMMTGVVACGNSDEKKDVATDNNSKETVSEEIKGNDVKEASEPENDEEWFAELAKRVNEGCESSDRETCSSIKQYFDTIKNNNLAYEEIVNGGSENGILIYFVDGKIMFDYNGNMTHVIKELESDLVELGSPRAANMTCYYLSWSLNKNVVNGEVKTVSDHEAGEISEKYKKILDAKGGNTTSNISNEDDNDNIETKRTTDETMELYCQSWNEKDYEKYSKASLEEHMKKDGFHTSQLENMEILRYDFKGINHSYIVDSYEELMGTGVEGFIKEVAGIYGINEEDIEGIAFQDYDIDVIYTVNETKLASFTMFIMFKLDGVWYLVENIYSELGVWLNSFSE